MREQLSFRFSIRFTEGYLATDYPGEVDCCEMQIKSEGAVQNNNLRKIAYC